MCNNARFGPLRWYPSTRWTTNTKAIRIVDAVAAARPLSEVVDLYDNAESCHDPRKMVRTVVAREACIELQTR